MFTHYGKTQLVEQSSQGDAREDMQRISVNLEKLKEKLQTTEA